MSDQDPFATPGTDDPFADPPPAAPAPAAPTPDVAEAAAEVAAQPQPAAPDPAQAPPPAPPQPQAEAPAAEIPVVDREGAPAGPLPTTPEDRGEEEAPAAPSAPEPVQEAQEPPPAPEPPQEQPPAPEVTPPQPPAPDITPPQAEAPAPVPVEEDDAVEPVKKEAELRYYKVLYQTGPTTFEVANLEGKSGAVEIEHEHVKGKAKKKEWFLQARNGEGALRVAFVAVGRPQNGVNLLVIPSGTYKVKPVKSKAPADREPLAIG